MSRRTCGGCLLVPIVLGIGVFLYAKQRLFESDEALGHADAALTRAHDEIEVLLDRVDNLEGEKGAP